MTGRGGITRDAWPIQKNNIRDRQCLCPNFCFCEIRYQPPSSKPRISWFGLVVLAIVVAVIVTGAIYWNHDPSTFPGQFGY